MIGTLRATLRRVLRANTGGSMGLSCSQSFITVGELFGKRASDA